MWPQYFGPISPGGTASLAGPQQPGTMLTSYGYSTDPNLDGASSQGIGAFAPFLHPGLIDRQSPGQPASAALSPDMEAKYAVQPGQTFQVTSSSGTTYNLIFSDRTAVNLTGRVDIYDPNNALAAGADVGQPITGIAFGRRACSNGQHWHPSCSIWRASGGCGGLWWRLCCVCRCQWRRQNGNGQRKSQIPYMMARAILPAGAMAARPPRSAFWPR